MSFALLTHAKYTAKSVLFFSLFLIFKQEAFLEQLMYDLMYLKRVYLTCSHTDMSASLLFSCKITKMKITDLLLIQAKLCSVPASDKFTLAYAVLGSQRKSS